MKHGLKIGRNNPSEAGKRLLGEAQSQMIEEGGPVINVTLEFLQRL